MEVGGGVMLSIISPLFSFHSEYMIMKLTLSVLCCGDIDVVRVVLESDNCIYLA